MTKLFQYMGLCALLGLAACATSRGNAPTSDGAPKATISGVQARKLVQEGGGLVDVRSADEYEQGHIEGAVNIPVDELPARLGELDDSTGPLILYCRTGGRAHKAAGVLQSHGYTDVHELGAMSNWPAEQR